MMNYNFGDVVMVPFPFIDRPIRKLRPALVLSNNPDGERNRHLILSMITSAKRSHWKSDVVLKDWESAGLKAESVIRWKVFTLEAALVQHKRGRLAAADLHVAENALKAVFRVGS